MTETEDRELRALLHDAVADVEPARTPNDLHARLDRQQPRRAWVPLTVAAAVVTALVLVGIPWLADRGPSTPPTAAPSAQIPVVAYALVEAPPGALLVADRRMVDDTGDPLVAALRATLAGQPADPDYQPLLPDAHDLEVEVTRVDGGVIVRLSDSTEVYEEASGGRLDDALRLTAAAALDDRRLRVDVVVGDAYETRLTPAHSSEFSLAAVVVDSVGEGQSFEGPFTVSGLASVYEGTVAWRLLDGERVVREGFTTAAECCTPSPYSFEVDAPPGDYVLEVAETDPSGGEGFPAYVDTKSITVR